MPAGGQLVSANFFILRNIQLMALILGQISFSQGPGLLGFFKSTPGLAEKSYILSAVLMQHPSVLSWMDED